jgi:hypothetical protein
MADEIQNDAQAASVEKRYQATMAALKDSSSLMVHGLPRGDATIQAADDAGRLERYAQRRTAPAPGPSADEALTQEEGDARIDRVIVGLDARIEQLPDGDEKLRLIDRKVALLGTKTPTETHVPGSFTAEDFRGFTKNAGLSSYEHYALMGALDTLRLDAPAKYVVAAAVGDTRAESLSQEQMEQRVSEWPQAIHDKYDKAVDVIHQAFPHGVAMMLLDRLHSTPRLVDELAKLSPRTRRP